MDPVVSDINKHNIDKYLFTMWYYLVWIDEKHLKISRSFRSSITRSKNINQIIKTGKLG